MPANDRLTTFLREYCLPIRMKSFRKKLNEFPRFLLRYLRRCAGIYESIPQTLISFYCLINPEFRRALQESGDDFLLVVLSLLFSISVVLHAILKIDRDHLVNKFEKEDGSRGSRENIKCNHCPYYLLKYY